MRIAEFGGFEILRAGGGPLFFWAEHGRGFGIQAFRSERLIYGQALSERLKTGIGNRIFPVSAR